MADVINVLTKLSQLDIDAAYAYEQALAQIEEKDIYNTIYKFREDHLRHINELSALIRQYNGTPPERTKDFKGYLIEGFTYLRSLTGTEGALKAMRSNEITTNKYYKQAIEENPNLPADVLMLLQRNFNDEKTHLSYITSTIKTFEEEVETA